MTGTATLRVWRGDAAGGGLVDFHVDVEDGEVVLDVVHRLAATQAPDLAVRWNCKAGKCGSCSAEVDGWPRLMCMTRMSVFDPGRPITVAPLKAFPVVRDLVTDVSANYRVAGGIPPFRPRPPEADGTRRMGQADVDRVQEHRQCIECFLCQDVCHVLRDHPGAPTSFAGPRFMVRLAELEMHPLDTLDRLPLLRRALGLGMCNITKCCTEVCPAGIRITDNAIIPLKERVADRYYDPVAWLGRKIGRRPARTPVADPWEPGPAGAGSPRAGGGDGGGGDGGGGDGGKRSLAR